MSVRFAAATREAARLFSPQHCHLNPFGGTVTRITRTFWFRFLALAVGLAIVSFGVACSGDDDDSTDETRDDVETEAESQEDDDDAADSDDDRVILLFSLNLRSRNKTTSALQTAW